MRQWNDCTPSDGNNVVVVVSLPIIVLNVKSIAEEPRRKGSGGGTKLVATL